MEAAGHGSGARRAAACLHDPGPPPPRCPELGHFLEELAPAGEKETQAVGELVDVEPSAKGSVDVSHPVGQRESQLLSCGGAGLAHVIPRSEEHTSELQSRQYLVC